MKLLTRQIQRAIARMAPAGELVGCTFQDWRTITFAGSRYQLTLRFSGEEAVEQGERLCDALPEHEFRIPGHMVVEATILRTENRYGRTPELTVTAQILLLKEH